MSMVKNNSFDERQILMRGKGFQIGFIVSLVMNLAIPMFEFFSVHVSSYSERMMGLWVPMTVVFVYFIINDAYEGINNKRGKPIMAVFAVAGLFMVIYTVCMVAVGHIAFVENNVIGDALGQIFVGLSMIVVAVTYFAKQIVDKKKINEE